MLLWYCDRREWQSVEAENEFYNQGKKEEL